MTTILVTGFGPFPGAPFNPTTPLVKKLARRPALAEVTLVPHVFPTSYDAVDRDLPKLIARTHPDALLMFGLAPRAKTLRVETRARNVASILPDAGGASPRRRNVEAGAPPRSCCQRRATSAWRGPCCAGASRALARCRRYLCNYLAWQAAELARGPRGPRLAAFIHVPNIRRHARPRAAKSRRTLDDLTRAGERLLVALAAAARR